MYTFQEAIGIIEEIQKENGEGLLETLTYMDRNLFQFDEDQRDAFRVVFTEMRKLFYK
jgi:hypothetical protein